MSDNVLHTNLMLSKQQSRVLADLAQSEYILQGIMATIRHDGASENMLSSNVTIHKLVSRPTPRHRMDMMCTGKVESAATICQSRHSRSKCIVPADMGVALQARHDAERVALYCCIHSAIYRLADNRQLWSGPDDVLFRNLLQQLALMGHRS